MPWTPLAQRIDSLPLILAGPILRRVEAHSVTVWVALRVAQTLTLEVYAGAPGNVILSGTGKTCSVGQHLHIVSISATNGTPLQAGQVYTYNIIFEDGRNLTSSGILQTLSYSCAIAYAPLTLPSFSLPPSDLKDLRILHGSCRKPHGEGQDAMPDIDTIIGDNATNADKRPHQLFLTGDQIYADDVADALLLLLHEGGQALLGWSETLPGIDGTNIDQLLPGRRVKLTRKIGFSSSLDDDDPTAKSHLMYLGEFLAMYLFVWSDLLWSPTLPGFQDIFPDIKDDDFEEDVDTEIGQLTTFRQGIPKVRRLLANVPCYMIADDHEITDDWFINLHWSKQVILDPLARRVVQNGLIGIAMCQTWGNSPEQFRVQTPTPAGQSILQALADLNTNHGNLDSARRVLAYALGMPFDDSDATIFVGDIDRDRFMQHEGVRPWQHALPLHFHIAWPKHEVIALDTRTGRGFSRRSDTDYPSLLSIEAFETQILDAPSHTNCEVSLVLLPGPVAGVPLIEWLQETSSDNKRLARDSEAWGLEFTAFERFFARLLKRSLTKPEQLFVLLCGDVHYGYTTRIQYWADNIFEVQSSQSIRAIFAQLTASSFRNQTKGSWFLNVGGTLFLHREGYKPILDSIPLIGPLLTDHQLDPKQILGWENPEGSSIEIGTLSFFDSIRPWYSDAGNPALANADGPGLMKVNTLTETPDWRYRIDYLLAEYEIDDDFKPVPVSTPPADRKDALKEYMKVSKNYDDYAERWGNGKEIVGVNNFGEVSFQWDQGQPRAIIHQIWWRLNKKNTDSPDLDPFPLSKFVVSLDLDDVKYPKPRPEI